MLIFGSLSLHLFHATAKKPSTLSTFSIAESSVIVLLLLNSTLHVVFVLQGGRKKLNLLTSLFLLQFT